MTMMPFKSILVAVDLRDGSGAAVESALSLASAHSRVTVVHVVRGVPSDRAFEYPYHLIASEHHRQLAQDAWRRIAKIIPTPATTSPRVRARVVTGEPAAEIARVAAEVDADLILVGVTARGALGRLLFGATAARVIGTAGRPVLAIPQLVDTAAVPARDEDLLAVTA